MKLEEKIAEALEKIIARETDFYHSIEGWLIAPVSGEQITFEYFEEDEFTAAYDFFISNKDKIKLTNSHREAKKGYGTQTLKKLEEGFIQLANNNQKIVEVEFNLFEQRDTEKWLQKNNYISNEEGLYRKEFIPN